MSEPLARRRPFAAVWVVTYPLLITYLTQKVLTTVDTALLGRFSTSALASVLLGGEAELTGAAVTYLRILAVAVPVAAAIFTLQSAFSGVGATRVAMYTALVVNAVDIPLGVIMIFGLGRGCRRGGGVDGPEHGRRAGLRDLVRPSSASRRAWVVALEAREALSYRRAGLRLAAVLTAVPGMATLLFPGPLFGLLTEDPTVLSVVVSTVALAVLILVPVVPAMNLWGSCGPQGTPARS